MQEAVEGIPEAVAAMAEEAADSLEKWAQEMTPFLTAYRISSAKLCRLSFS
jgi:hypothetical protein